MASENVTTDLDFEEQTKRLFDESVAALDGETRSKLTQARYRALEEMKPRRQTVWTRALVPVGVAAAVAMLTITLWQGQIPSADDGDFDVAAVTDLEILLSEEELDMIEELEFYAWLEEQVELTEGQIVEDGIG